MTHEAFQYLIKNARWKMANGKIKESIISQLPTSSVEPEDKVEAEQKKQPQEPPTPSPRLGDPVHIGPRSMVGIIAI
jgi:hypothetical protein